MARRSRFGDGDYIMEHNGRRVYPDRDGNPDFERYEDERLGEQMWQEEQETKRLEREMAFEEGN